MGAKDLREHEGEGGTAARALLEAIPGIDGAMASGLLEHFGTLAALAWADERELRDVQGLSETQVRELLNTFRGGED
jgi:ERCC4-type nuclease